MVTQIEPIRVKEQSNAVANLHRYSGAWLSGHTVHRANINNAKAHPWAVSNFEASTSAHTFS
jgi:hypothetical protein